MYIQIDGTWNAGDSNLQRAAAWLALWGFARAIAHEEQRGEDKDKERKITSRWTYNAAHAYGN